MASSTKIIYICLCAIASSFVIVSGGDHNHYGIIEPLLAAGVITMLLKNKGPYGYTGRAQSYHQQRHHEQQHQPAVQAYEPAVQNLQEVREVQGHVVQEYQEPGRGNSPRYELGKYQYQDDAAAEMYTQPRYVSHTALTQPRYIRYQK